MGVEEMSQIVNDDENGQGVGTVAAPKTPALSLVLAMEDSGPVRLTLDVIDEEYSGQFYIDVQAPKSDGAILNKWQRMGGAAAIGGGKQFVQQMNMDTDQLFRLRWVEQTKGFCLPAEGGREPITYDESKGGRNKHNERALALLMLPKSKGLRLLWAAFMDFVAVRDDRDEQFDEQFKLLGNAPGPLPNGS